MVAGNITKVERVIENNRTSIRHRSQQLNIFKSSRYRLASSFIQETIHNLDSSSISSRYKVDHKFGEKIIEFHPDKDIDKEKLSDLGIYKTFIRIMKNVCNLRVWCGLWLGGIIRSVFFLKTYAGNTVTVNGVMYRNMLRITKKF